MSWVQARGSEMMSQHGFLGVPTETFEKAGRLQLMALLNQGLCPESKLLDIGCGCLRTAYWLIRFLDADCYCGIEPARNRVELGLRYLFTPEIVSAKRPRFDFNPHFDSSVFGTTFDYFLAGSIWAHASKRQSKRPSIPSSATRLGEEFSSRPTCRRNPSMTTIRAIVGSEPVTNRTCPG